MRELFSKVAGLRHRYFAVNFAKSLRKPFLQNTSGRLLLHLAYHWHIQRALAYSYHKAYSDAKAYS